MITRNVFVAAMAAIGTFVLAHDASAHSNGVTGSAVGGCAGGACHGGSSASTMVTIEGPTSVVRGSMNTYTLVIANMGASQTGAGVDIAATQGSLTAGSPTTTVRAGEITHSSVIARTPGTTSVRVPFTWTAPAAAGTARINAAGNAVDNSRTSAGDQWAVGSLSITVTDTMMGDSGVAPPDSGVAPRDSGVAPADSGVAPQDSGVAPQDSGVAPQDSGSALPPLDSGVVPPQDSGVAPPQDSGVAPADAGTTPMSMGGCGCTTVPTAVDPRGALLAVAALGAMVARRRKR
jgi:MYXO-CTERM domain-containing protein